MVDTGATVSLLKPGEYGAAVNLKRNVDVRTVTGGTIRTEGQQEPVVTLPSGRSTSFEGTVSPDARAVCSQCEIKLNEFLSGMSLGPTVLMFPMCLSSSRRTRMTS